VETHNVMYIQHFVIEDNAMLTECVIICYLDFELECLTDV
jgi:hypothetical protein